MTRPLRLLEFVTSFEIGGTERQVTNLVCGLDRARFRVHVACFLRQGAMLPEVLARGEPVTEYRLSSLRSLGAVWAQLRLVRYCLRERLDVVHTFGFYPNVFGIPAARLAGVGAVVASIRDTGDHLSGFQRRIQRWACGFADRVLVNAEAVRAQLLRDGYPAEKIQMIPNGIRSAESSPAGHSGTLHAELGLAPELPLVGVFSRLTRMKGIEYFLDAAAILVQSHLEACFVVVGDSVADVADGPDFRAELEGRAAQLGLQGRVFFTGRRSDVARLLPEFSVSVLPSLSEGLSNAILESMGAGLPVVATVVGGNPELVRQGVTGYLVPPRDAQALASAIELLLDAPARAAAFGEAGRRVVLERFSLAAMVRDTEAVYASLAGTSRGARDPARGHGADAEQAAS